MLKQLRHKKRVKQLLWTTIILITLPFIFWGISTPLRSRQKGSAYAGAIFGKKVSFEEYSAAWKAVRNQALLTYGSKFNQVSETLNLDQQAWERLILLAEAKKRRFSTSNQEVIDTIQNFPFLQSKGQFDKRAYDLVLSQVFRVNAREFEEGIRGSLTVAKLVNAVIKNIKLTNKEIIDAYKKENEKSKIAYILISANRFKNKVEIEEEAIKRYYEGNAESFRIPEQVNIEYIGFEFSDYQKDIQISDEEIKNYYEGRKDEFDSKKEFKDLKDTIKVKLIQKTAKQNALIAAEKIDYILADKTKSLEEVAMENSIPIKETGFFSKQGPIPNIGWLPEIQKIAFKLKPGERSELIKSDMDFASGYYIIKLKENKPSYIPSLEETREKVEDILKDEASVTLASKQATRLHKKILELIKIKNITFEEAAEKIRHKPKYTQPFTRNDYVQGIGLANELGEVPFKTSSGQVSSVIKTRAGFCIFSVVEITPIDEKKFKKERKDFVKKTLQTKKIKLLDEWYSNLMKEANLKSNIISEEK